MSAMGVTPELLVPAGKALLLGAFGVQLVQVTRGSASLSGAFEKFAIGFLALVFFQSIARGLDGFSVALTESIQRVANSNELTAVVLEAFTRAAQEKDASGEAPWPVNVPALVEQAWRTGVWGVMNAIIEGLFLIVSFILESAREVLWHLLLVLFPIAAGLYPVFPRMAANLGLYAIELSLWQPTLALVEGVTAQVARQHLTESGSLGLTLIGVEVVACLLILSIPAVTRRFMSGAFAGDLDSQSSVFKWAKLLAVRVQAMGGPR
jgi:hypothetical protein